MPKLPIVSGADAVRALERLGFVITRQRGSHIVMRRGSSGCVVPNHRELKIGTLAGLLKQAGVSTDEFIKTLNPSSAP
jgi:predicted RNA binding protein YcfA (HicA-like mRNA interferase family)